MYSKAIQLYIGLSLVCICMLMPVECFSGKKECTKNVLDRIDLLYVLADSKKTNANGNSVEIKRVVSGLGGRKQLFMFAVLCHGIAWPQDANDISFDDLFVDAFWEAVERISELPPKQSESCLDDLKAYLNLQGGDLIRFEMIEARSQRKAE